MRAVKNGDHKCSIVTLYGEHCAENMIHFDVHIASVANMHFTLCTYRSL